VLLRHCRSLAGFLVENEATNELNVVHNAAELLEDKDVTKVEEVRVHEIHHRQGGVDGERREDLGVPGDDLGVEGGGRGLDEGVPVGEFDGDGHFVEDLIGGQRRDPTAATWEQESLTSMPMVVAG
jgi:hypothetical protein